MNNFSSLVSKIEEVMREKPHVLVAISGFGGSGKSSLTKKLCEHFDIQERQVVCVDHLYGPNPDGPDILDQTDWPRLIQILDKAILGERLQYTGKDFRGNPLHFDEALPHVVIFEGIRLLQPDFISKFDVSVWIDCPQNTALERAKERDRLQGESEEMISRWDTDWGPKDKEYFERYRPDKIATTLFSIN